VGEVPAGDSPGNPELVDFVQRALGYSVTGDVREDRFFVGWGKGRNGKSTLLGTIQRILGDYAKQMAPDALLKRLEKGDTHPTAIADLCGARFAVVQETEEGKHLATAVVKAMTGRDKLKARYMRKDYFEFEPTHKIWLSTNYKPVIGDTIVAMWSRIVLIPFVSFFDEEHQDKTLPEKLWNEREGILKWLVEGCLKWQKEGLKPPQVVVEATKTYQSEMDVLQRWFEECCVCDPKAVTAFKDLYASYEAWCRECDETPISKRKFGDRLEEKGFGVVILSRNQKGRKGLRLREGQNLPPEGHAPSSDEPKEQEEVTQSVTDVTDVTDFPILTSKSSIYRSLYRKYGNIGNISNTPLEEHPVEDHPEDLPDWLQEPLEDEVDDREEEEAVAPKNREEKGVVTDPPKPPCPVCDHPKRDEIEYLFDCGIPVKRLGEKYQLSTESLHLHMELHRGS
jgi:P4 family phage/plasmid primase-like protien